MPKYKYTGLNNTTCPVCSKRIERGTPVLYFNSGVKFAEHKWCNLCFTKVYAMNNYTTEFMEITKREIERMTRISLKGNYPEDHEIGGYWVSSLDPETLLLVIDLKSIWDY